MRTEPVSLVVARATVAGAPEISIVSPPEVRARINQPLQLKFSYRLEETSKEREEWTFSLKANVGAQSPPGVQAKWKDRRIVTDDLWGTLMQEFVFTQPGRYDAGFEVRANYSQSNWSSGAAGAKMERKGSGRFVLIVER